MTISELMKTLADIQTMHGDIVVVSENEYDIDEIRVIQAGHWEDGSRVLKRHHPENYHLRVSLRDNASMY